MIFKLETTTVGGIRYLSGSRLVSEWGTPDYALELPAPPDLEWIDENGKLQYAIESNPDYDDAAGPGPKNRPYSFVLRPQALTPGEAGVKLEDAVKRAINERYDAVDIIDALIDFKNGDSAKLDDIESNVRSIRGVR